jgi:lactoylglutathione lyase
VPAAERARARFLGLNHVTLEVADVDAALAFYGGLMAFEDGGRHGTEMAFLDAGDQFLAVAATGEEAANRERHFGLVVDDRAALLHSLRRLGVEPLPGRGLSFRDPWGNRFQVVQYDEIRFTKTPEVLRGMGVDGLTKTPAARAELEDALRDPVRAFCEMRRQHAAHVGLGRGPADPWPGGTQDGEPVQARPHGDRQLPCVRGVERRVARPQQCHERGEALVAIDGGQCARLSGRGGGGSRRARRRAPAGARRRRGTRGSSPRGSRGDRAHRARRGRTAPRAARAGRGRAARRGTGSLDRRTCTGVH